MDSDQGSSMFGPLTFPEHSKVSSMFHFTPWESSLCQCMFCSDNFKIPEEKDLLLSHLFQVHRLVIADAHLICSLKSYCEYWKVRFSKFPIQNFCNTVTTDNGEYYLLSDVHPEDLELRQGLASKRLEWVLECQSHERDDRTFERSCLFCSYVEKESRSSYLTHLSYQHNLQLGRPDNLVFVDKLLDKIEDKMNKLQCIYCEHVFKDRVVLKEHMRKKIHKRINPKNKEYDCFYVINYLEGENNEKRHNEQEIEHEWSKWREEGSDWSDWQEPPSPIVCLFCLYTCTEWEEILQHLLHFHNFSYWLLMKNYNFYEQVKIVNYIRREVHLLRCYHCKLKFESRELLLNHMNVTQHFVMPDRQHWDQPEFFFSTYENDTFLSLLEDNEDDPVDKLSSSLSSSCSTHTNT